MSCGAEFAPRLFHMNYAAEKPCGIKRLAADILDTAAQLSLTVVGCGQNEERSCVAAFQFNPRHRKHNLPDQLRVYPRSDRNGIA